MPKRIGIVTIIDNNYGNRLQNYAMEQLLMELGYEVRTIRNLRFKDWYYLAKDRRELLRAILYRNKYLVDIVHKFKGKNKSLPRPEGSKIRKNRDIAFEIFNDKYIHFDSFVLNKEPVTPFFHRKFDCFITGSDQVWNPLFGYAAYNMYLRFAPRKKRIAIAASFGMNQIPIEHQQLMKKYLSEMRYISVREESGRTIVKQLTGKDCDIIMDPTLLVSPKVWGKILKQVTIEMPENYLLVYFLGGISLATERYIYEIAEKRHLNIVVLNSEHYPEYYSAGPAEFIYYIKKATLIFTDSFHGCVFSCIFHKQFVAFKRLGDKIDMFDRVETLLKRLQLSNKMIYAGSEQIYTITQEEFERADYLLSLNREKTKEIIRRLIQ